MWGVHCVRTWFRVYRLACSPFGELKINKKKLYLEILSKNGDFQSHNIMRRLCDSWHQFWVIVVDFPREIFLPSVVPMVFLSSKFFLIWINKRKQKFIVFILPKKLWHFFSKTKQIFSCLNCQSYQINKLISKNGEYGLK